MWCASAQPPYGTSMPKSGRRPPHQKQPHCDGRFASDSDQVVAASHPSVMQSIEDQPGEQVRAEYRAAEPLVGK
jgi:hypothetical protein